MYATLIENYKTIKSGRSVSSNVHNCGRSSTDTFMSNQTSESHSSHRHLFTYVCICRIPQSTLVDATAPRRMCSRKFKPIKSIPGAQTHTAILSHENVITIIDEYPYTDVALRCTCRWSARAQCAKQQAAHVFEHNTWRWPPKRYSNALVLSVCAKLSKHQHRQCNTEAMCAHYS